VGLCAAYGPRLGAAASGLDDARSLQQLATAPLSSVWGCDRFGHLRPLKSLWLWCIAQQPGRLALFRGGVLAALLLSTWLLQRSAARHLGDRWAGLAVAATWALNPTTPAVVSWLSAANLAFAGLGLLAYLELGEPPLLTPTRAWLACALLVPAVLAHELALLAPALWLVRARDARPGRAARDQLLLGSAGVLLAWAALRASVACAVVPYRLQQAPSWQLSVSAARYLFENLRLWLWLPGRFGVLLADRPAAHWLASALAWLALLAAALLVLRVRALQAGVLWCALLLVPLVDLFPLRNTPVAMHYLYLPGMGLSLALVQLARRVRLGYAALLLLWAAWLPAGQHARAAFADDARLYEASLAAHPDNLEVRANLASVYLDRARYERADALLAESLALAPDEPVLLRNRLELLLRQERAADALALWQSHPALQDDCVDALRLGQLLERAQKLDAAVSLYERALPLAEDPDQRRFALQSLARMRALLDKESP
jgi:hypothetical protein